MFYLCILSWITTSILALIFFYRFRRKYYNKSIFILLISLVIILLITIIVIACIRKYFGELINCSIISNCSTSLITKHFLHNFSSSAQKCMLFQRVPSNRCHITTKYGSDSKPMRRLFPIYLWKLWQRTSATWHPILIWLVHREAIPCLSWHPT